MHHERIGIVTRLLDLVVGSDLQLFIPAIGLDLGSSSDLYFFDRGLYDFRLDRLMEIDHIAAAAAELHAFLEAMEERRDAQYQYHYRDTIGNLPVFDEFK